VPAHVAQLGTITPRGGFEGRCPSTFHSWVLLPRGKVFREEVQSRKRLVKTGSCSSLNSQKEPIPTQSLSVAAWEIRRGRARICWRGAQGQERPANHEGESCGRRTARKSADVDRLRVGARERRRLAEECERDRRGAMLWSRRNSTLGGGLVCW
jgi:hypothetical protein